METPPEIPPQESLCLILHRPGRPPAGQGFFLPSMTGSNCQVNNNDDHDRKDSDCQVNCKGR